MESDQFYICRIFQQLSGENDTVQVAALINYFPNLQTHKTVLNYNDFCSLFSEFCVKPRDVYEQLQTKKTMIKRFSLDMEQLKKKQLHQSSTYVGFDPVVEKEAAQEIYNYFGSAKMWDPKKLQYVKVKYKLFINKNEAIYADQLKSYLQSVGMVTHNNRFYDIFFSKQKGRNKFYGRLIESIDDRSISTFYTFIQKVGQGKFGTMYKGKSILNGNFVAIKKIDKHKDGKPNYQHLIKLRKEAQIMRQIKHENIVEIVDEFEDQNYLYIVTEYVENGDLKSFLQQHKPTWMQLIAIFEQIIDGLCYIHFKNIIHKDLKPDNILIQLEGDRIRAKIADFGLSYMLISADQMIKEFSGTPVYMAPEILQRQSYNNKIDVWSVGIIIYLYVYNRYPFELTRNIDQLLKNISQSNYQFPPIDGKIEFILKKTLEKDYNLRYNSNQLRTKFIELYH